MILRSLSIRKGTIEECIYLSNKIPEFQFNYDEKEFNKRLTKVYSLIYIAEEGGVMCGFKVGYARESFFYSWIGGVLPQFRYQGVAKTLATIQEEEVRKRGFNEIRFKTYNTFKPMLIFGLKNGFEIINFEREKDAIWLKKELYQK